MSPRPTAVHAILALAIAGAAVLALPMRSSSVSAPKGSGKDVVYSNHMGVPHMLDVHRADKKPHPAVILVHGGGWYAGDKSRWSDEADGLARRGFVVFNVNFGLACVKSRKLCGHHGWDMVRDLRQAVVWVRKNGHAYGAITDRVGVFGSSSGAQLVMLLATTGEGDVRPDATVELSGAAVLAPAVGAPTDGAKVLEKSIVRFVGCPFVGKGECPNRWRDLSPIRHVSSDDGPMLLVHGLRDPFAGMEQPLAMQAAMGAAGAKVSFKVIDSVQHGGGLFDLALPTAAEFLHRNLD